MFLVVTTRTADSAIAAANAPNTICRATISRRAPAPALRLRPWAQPGPERPGRGAARSGRNSGCRSKADAGERVRREPTHGPSRSLLGALLRLGARFEGRGLGHGEHPLTEAVLVMQQ